MNWKRASNARHVFFQTAMPLSFVTETRDGYFNVKFSGEYTFDELLALIDPIRSAADAAEFSRVLMDARLVSGKMSESEKFFVGVKIAEVFGPNLTAAIVMRPGDVTKMGEMAAVNRGANLLVTESWDEASRWLLGSAIRTTA